MIFLSKKCIQKLSAKVDQFTLTIKLNSEVYYDLYDYKTSILKQIYQVAKVLKIEIFDKYQSDTNIKGYNRTFEYGGNGIRIAYHTKLLEQGIIVYFTAGGWLRYCNQIGKNISEILQGLAQLRDKSDWLDSFRLTRLDFAVDMYDSKAKIDTLANGLKRGTYDYFNARNSRNKQKLKLVYDGTQVQTLYLGSRQSEFFFRCYDKKAEQLNAKEPLFYDEAKSLDYWFRFEAEMKGELVHRLTLDLLELENEDDINELLASVVFQRVKFKSRKTEKLHYVSQAFELIASGESYENVIRQVNRNQPLEKSKEWFFSDNCGLVGLLYKIKEMQGDKAVDDYLQKLHEFLNDEYIPSQGVLNWLDRNR